jgi:GNAT superfamily N-acetyltransferase
MPPEIHTFRDEDRAPWERLARAYKAFYRTVLPDAAYDQTWRRLRERDGIHGLGAHTGGRLVGITHYLFHTGIWSAQACYLEDLFVDPACRGRGVARTLIEAVATNARAHGATRLYWLTHESNATARALYDKVASASGFVEYEYPMTGAGPR